MSAAACRVGLGLRGLARACQPGPVARQAVSRLVQLGLCLSGCGVKCWAAWARSRAASPPKLDL